MNKLSDKIKDLRRNSKLSQKEIAEILNITQQAYANYENEKREIPVETLIKIADFYNVSLDSLTNRENSDLTDEEKTILSNWNRLNEKNKGKVELFIEQLLDMQYNIKDVI